MPTALIYDERFLTHDNGPGLLFLPPIPEQEPEEHVATRRLVARTKHLLDASGLTAGLVEVAPRVATVEELCRFHTPAYVARIRAYSEGGGGDAGSITPVGPRTYEVAVLAAGGALCAVEAVLAGQVTNAYALLRPPGHHALPDFGMGSCIFGNVALAALHARRLGSARVAIVDWDVHHGNGTEAAFDDDPSVLFISLHQDALYPVDTGAVDSVGTEAGRGYTVNIPLPPGTGDAGFEAAFERLVLPILRQFRPELLLVSAGQDASIYDPFGRMMVSSDGYRTMTVLLQRLAEEICGGRLVICHEGGYSTVYVPFCTLAIVEALSGRRSRVADPFLPSIESIPAVRRVALEAEQAIGRAVAIQRAYWQLG